MAEESAEKKSAPKKVFNVVSTSKYIILSSESNIVEITSGGHAKGDGVKFSIGVSFKDINEERTRKKLGKVEPRLSEKEIDLVVKKNRISVVSMYKQEVLSKLADCGAEADLVKAVEKELKEDAIAALLH